MIQPRSLVKYEKVKAAMDKGLSNDAALKKYGMAYETFAKIRAEEKRGSVPSKKPKNWKPKFVDIPAAPQAESKDKIVVAFMTPDQFREVIR